MKEAYGEPSTSNTNYTGDCFSKWGSIAALGMSADDIANLRTDDELPVIIESLAGNEDKMEESQVSVPFLMNLSIGTQNY